MHDPRATGFQRRPAACPTEQAMRSQWYEAQRVLADNGNPDSGVHRQHFDHIDQKLTKFLWDRAWAIREEDRRLHPKAKRNQLPPPKTPQPFDGLASTPVAK